MLIYIWCGSTDVHPRAELGHRPRDTDRHGARRHRDPNWHGRGNWRHSSDSVSIHTRGGDFDATGTVVANNATLQAHTRLDAPGSDRATSFAYQRATLNGALKTELVNDCLSDAVVYSGQHGDLIRAAMKLAVCHELGGTLVAGQPCDLTSAGPDAI